MVYPRVFLKGRGAVYKLVKSSEGLTILKTNRTFVIVNSSDYTRWALRAAFWHMLKAEAKPIAFCQSRKKAEQRFNEILQTGA